MTTIVYGRNMLIADRMETTRDGFNDVTKLDIFPEPLDFQHDDFGKTTYKVYASSYAGTTDFYFWFLDCVKNYANGKGSVSAFIQRINYQLTDKPPKFELMLVAKDQHNQWCCFNFWYTKISEQYEKGKSYFGYAVNGGMHTTQKLTVLGTGEWSFKTADMLLDDLKIEHTVLHSLALSCLFTGKSGIGFNYIDLTAFDKGIQTYNPKDDQVFSKILDAVNKHMQVQKNSIMNGTMPKPIVRK